MTAPAPTRAPTHPHPTPPHFLCPCVLTGTIVKRLRAPDRDPYDPAAHGPQHDDEFKPIVAPN